MAEIWARGGEIHSIPVTLLPVNSRSTANGRCSPVVICTFNRATDIGYLLEDISRQVALPSATVVVDASSNEMTRDVTSRFTSRIPTLRYIHAAPSLPRQRNIGLHQTRQLDEEKGSFVHFLDDDVRIPDNYFAEMEGIMAQLPDSAVCLGPADAGIVQHLPQKVMPRFLHHKLLVGGRVARSGRNLPVRRSRFTLRVDWLPGNAWCMKTALLGNFTFDESWGFMGEDLEASLLLRHRGELFWTPHVMVHHRPSPNNRFDEASYIRHSWRARLQLADQFPERVDKLAIKRDITKRAFAYSALSIFGGTMFRKKRDEYLTLGQEIRCMSPRKVKE